MGKEKRGEGEEKMRLEAGQGSGRKGEEKERESGKWQVKVREILCEEKNQGME